MTKEEIYDTQISPLMQQIIEICQLNKIAMLASFHLPDETQDTLHCTTGLVLEEYQPSLKLLEGWNVIRPKSPSLTLLKVDKANGNHEITVIAGN